MSAGCATRQKNYCINQMIGYNGLEQSVRAGCHLKTSNAFTNEGHFFTAA